MRSLVWFKNDLRLHDNEALCRAIATDDELAFVYCVDDRLFKKTDLGFRKAGYTRYLFMRDAILDLQKSLEEIGGHLHILMGIPEQELVTFIEEHNIKSIYAEKEYAPEELNIISKLKSQLDSEVAFHFFWGKTLYHIDDIPFEISTIPLTSKAYRIPVSKQTEVREPFKAPVAVNTYKGISSNKFPDADEYAFAKAEFQSITPYVSGGERNGLKRLEHYTFQTEQLTNYRYTRNRSQGMDYSSKFSPYLALGCLSPRLIYDYVKRYEKTVKKNQSTWWLVFELVWRDYFTFKGMRMGNVIFKTEGYKNKNRDFENDKNLFKRWCEGMTGIPFIDAHMRQLNLTGYMSNRGRVNCSSFLVHDYKIDWTWGAAYFESRLIDYDVSANWMNWHMQAFETYYTNPVHQSLKYKAADYIREWVEELREVTTNYVYAPWLLNHKISDYPASDAIYKKWGRSIKNIEKSIE